jgi:trigger factor
MNISLQNMDKGSAELTLKIEKADYQEQVDKSLKNFRQKAQMPGFRRGMVPAGLIKKMYGKSVIAEEVNKMVSEAVYKYVEENKLKVLGKPLASDKQQDIDFDADQEGFEFIFDLVLEPELTVEVTAKDKVNYYQIEVTDEMVDNRIDAYTARNGKYEQVENYQDKDMLKGLLTELDENGEAKEGGITVDDCIMMPSYMKNEAQKTLFSTAKTGDLIKFNPHTAWDGNVAELTSLLKIEAEDAEKVTADFSYRVDEVTRFVKGELNQEVFDQVLGKDAVKTEEEFRAKVKEDMEASYVQDSDYKFLLDFREVMLKKAGTPDYPEPLMKKLMSQVGENSDEMIEEHYAKSIEQLTWQLLKEKFTKEYNLEVSQDDVMAMAKESTRMQFAQYGMMNVPEDLLQQYAGEMLKKQETVNNLVSNVIDRKLTAAVKPLVKLNTKKISVEEFNKMFDQEQE